MTETILLTTDSIPILSSKGYELHKLDLVLIQIRLFYPVIIKKLQSMVQMVSNKYSITPSKVQSTCGLIKMQTPVNNQVQARRIRVVRNQMKDTMMRSILYTIQIQTTPPMP